VPSVSPIAKRGGRRRLGVLRPLAIAGCVCLLGAGAAGCSTTQEKAAAQKAKSEHILKAQAERKRAKKHHVDGPKTRHQGKKSAHQQEGSR
jgi:hypothetical protein